jgi:hypothetical protein
MGNFSSNTSSVPATQAQGKYGLASYEAIMLQEYFNTSAAIDRRRFSALYAIINPDAIGPYFEHAANQAFLEADLNRDGYITFDELIKSYLKSKKVKEDLDKLDRGVRKRRLFPY